MIRHSMNSLMSWIHVCTKCIDQNTHTKLGFWELLWNISTLMECKNERWPLSLMSCKDCDLISTVLRHNIIINYFAIIIVSLCSYYCILFITNLFFEGLCLYYLFNFLNCDFMFLIIIIIIISACDTAQEIHYSNL